VKIYIYTIPKAGTYLLAEFLERLGFENSGFHVDLESYLDTKKLSLEVNAQTPEAARVDQFFVGTLKGMPDNSLAFGHLAVPLLGWALPRFSFVCSYRHPRKTLVSEFIDFRFRRKDVEWLSFDTIADDAEAFGQYLIHHGPIHLRIFSQFVACSTLFNDPFFQRYTPERSIFVNFDTFLKDPSESVRIAEHFGRDAATGLAAREAALAAETKTKAVDLEIDRDSLWTAENERLYEDLGVFNAVERARSTGLDI